MAFQEVENSTSKIEIKELGNNNIVLSFSIFWSISHSLIECQLIESAIIEGSGFNLCFPKSSTTFLFSPPNSSNTILLVE